VSNHAKELLEVDNSNHEDVIFYLNHIAGC